MGKFRYKDPDLESRERSYHSNEVSYNAVEYQYPNVASKHNFRQWDTKNYEKFRDMLRKNRTNKKEVSVESDVNAIAESTEQVKENNTKTYDVSNCKKKKKKKSKRNCETLSENESDLSQTKNVSVNIPDQIMSEGNEVFIKQKSKKKKKSKADSDIINAEQISKEETSIADNVQIDICKKSKKKKKKKFETDPVILEEPVLENCNENPKKLKKRKKSKNEIEEELKQVEIPIPKKKCKNELCVEACSDDQGKKKKKKKRDKSSEIIEQAEILQNGIGIDEDQIKNNSMNEEVGEADSLNKVKKKKCKKEKYHIHVNEEETEPRTEKKNKKKRKHLVDKETTVIQSEDTPELKIVKKKSKKSKNIDVDTSRGAAVEDSLRKSKKKKSEMPIPVDCKQEKSNHVVMGQWSTVKFEDTDRKDKFMRLMGGIKAGSSGVKDTVKFNTAVSGENEKKLNEGLEKQYTDALDILTVKGKGSGLGFQKDPAEGKKFYINVSKTKSVKFDD